MAPSRSIVAAPPPVETELKLRIAPDAIPALVRHPALLSVKRGRAHRSRLLSTYYDTEDGLLANAGIALRVRRDGRRWLQTVKGPAAATSAGGLSARAEYEWPVTGPHLDPLRFATTPFRRELRRAEQRGLGPRFVTDFVRTIVPVAFGDSTMAHLCIDVGDVRTDDGGPALRAPIHEIELELEAGAPARLYELAYALAADLPLAFEPASKAERGYALRHPVPPAPVRAAEARLPAHCTAAEAFAAFIRSCLDQVERNADGVLRDDDPEWIHQMRIGVRRLRACLSLARKGIAPARIEPMRVEWRWLAQALGPARDLDVFTLSTLPAFAAAVGRDDHSAPVSEALAVLARRSGERCREARVLARAAVASPRFVQLVLTAAHLAATLATDATTDTAGRVRLARSARKFARPLQKRRHQDLLALATDLAHATPQARHAARLAAKKLRYAAEFFASLYQGKRTRAYRKALATLQDELGLWNDTAVAARLAAGLAGADSPAAAAFSGWAAARGAERAALLAAAWNRFAKVRPYWSHR